MKHLLALLLLITPAQAENVTEILKTQSCDTVPVRIVQAEPEIHYLNPVLAIAMARQWVRDEKARRMAVPCKKPGRIRSPKDEQCWLPGRMP